LTRRAPAQPPPTASTAAGNPGRPSLFLLASAARA
jgi:hypothetical protein